MATTSTTELTGPLSDTNRPKGTIIDWNLSYKASGLSTSRQVRSGTPAFMALSLLDPDVNVQQRTLKHDLESFFAVILYMTLSHKNAKWQKSTFARAFDMSKDFEDIYTIKSSMLLVNFQFKKACLNYIDTQILGGGDIKMLLEDMRSLLYSDYGDEDMTGSYEELFRDIIDIIDRYLHDDHGRRRLEAIDARKEQSTMAD